MQVTLHTYTPEPEKNIEYVGRFSFHSQHNITPDSYKTFITKRIVDKHFAILEHSSATFIIQGISRVTANQLVRHRIASYMQESQRYVNQKNTKVVIPPTIIKLMNGDNLFRSEVDLMLSMTNTLYQYLLEKGVPKEDARFFLKLGTETNIVITANFRSFREMLEKRLDKAAQWEIRTLFKEIFYSLISIAPHCFEDLNKLMED